MTSPKVSLVILSLAALSLIPTAKAACAVSGTPTFSGAAVVEGNGNQFYTEQGGTGGVQINFTAAPNSATPGTRTGHLTVLVNGSAVKTMTFDENSTQCSLKMTSASQISASAGTYTLTFTETG